MTAKTGALAQHNTTLKKGELSANQQGFLAAFAESASVSHAASAAKCDRTRHYHWLKNAAYAEAFSVAQATAVEALEKEARRRAIEGTREPIFYRGEEVGDRIKYSDLLLIFLLKAARPETYRDRYEITATTEPPKVHDPGRDVLSDEMLDRLIAIAEEQAQQLDATTTSD